MMMKLNFHTLELSYLLAITWTTPHYTISPLFTSIEAAENEPKKSEPLLRLRMHGEKLAGWFSEDEIVLARARACLKLNLLDTKPETSPERRVVWGVALFQPCAKNSLRRNWIKKKWWRRCLLWVNRNDEWIILCGYAKPLFSDVRCETFCELFFHDSARTTSYYQQRRQENEIFVIIFPELHGKAHGKKRRRVEMDVM